MAKARLKRNEKGETPHPFAPEFSRERNDVSSCATTSTTGEEGAANGTGNREVGVLLEMLRPAFGRSKLLRLSIIHKPKEAAPRQGFFEAEQYEAAYLLKETFGQLWSYRREAWARRFFEHWYASLKWQRLKLS